MQDHPVARHVADQCVEVPDQARNPVEGLGEGFEPLAQQRLGPTIVAHPTLDQRPCQGPDVDFGIEASADPLDQDHGFLQQQQLGLGFHLELLGHPEQLGEQAGDRNFLQRPAEDRLADRAAGLGKGVNRPGGGDIARSEMDLGHPPVVARQKADQHVGEVIAGGAVEPAHDPKIDDDDRPRRVDEHVSRVHVGVKEAVAEHLVEKGAGGLGQQLVDAVPDGNQRGTVVGANAGDPLEGQHAAAGALPIDPRHAKAGIAGKVFAELGRGRGFEAQIHLETDHFGQGLHDLDRLEPPRRRVQALDPPGEPQKQIEVAGERLGHARPQHLDRDLMPVRGAGEMDLGDRGRGNRGFVERGEQGFERPAELGLDRRPRLVPRKRRQAILEARQIGRDLFAEDIGPGRQQLAELDEARPHFVERGGEPLTRARGRRTAPTGKDPGAAQIEGEPGDGGKRKQRVVAREGQADRGEPGEVAQAAQRREPGSRSLRDASPNEAQRCPP